MGFITYNTAAGIKLRDEGVKYIAKFFKNCMKRFFENLEIIKIFK